MENNVNDNNQEDKNENIGKLDRLSKLSRGPFGLGDPEDQTLRKVEIEVMIPKIVRERSKYLKCHEFKKEFDKCCLDNALNMVFKCRKENQRYKECLHKWFFDEQFVKECREIYLNKRSEYRRTGQKRQINFSQETIN